mmetsp:Transcript_16143/g.54271  ORF Transcript_16143/g.54271 Transcript_16143/m.54271 type:complete len:241 (-) Transcript_16143:456-1178(-)
MAVSLMRGIRDAPPTTSTRSTSLGARPAWSKTARMGVSSRGQSASQRRSNSARFMTMRKSVSSCSASMATGISLLAESTSLMRSASLRILPMPRSEERRVLPGPGCALTNSSARYSPTQASKSRPPRPSSQATPLTTMAPCVLFFLLAVAENSTAVTLRALEPRSRNTTFMGFSTKRASLSKPYLKATAVPSCTRLSTLRLAMSAARRSASRSVAFQKGGTVRTQSRTVPPTCASDIFFA